MDCAFNKFENWTLPVPKEGPIVHQRLRALTLGHGSQSENLIDYITLPALSSFSLRLYWVDMWGLGSLRAFLLRSGTLKTIEIHISAISTYQLPRLLRLLPKLTELSIKGDIMEPFGDSLFESLTYYEGLEGLPLCPELRAITFGGCLGSKQDTIAKMLLSRCCLESSRPRIARLQKVAIFRNGLCMMQRRQIEAIQDYGLDVTFI